jgi:hypothetical protein
MIDSPIAQCGREYEITMHNRAVRIPDAPAWIAA